MNNFIFYGNGNELVSNRRDDQEISVLSLHLLQASMVYVNTLMIQDVLADQQDQVRTMLREGQAIRAIARHFNVGVATIDRIKRSTQLS